MKLIKVDNTELSIVDLDGLKIAFSYRTPIAIMHETFCYITDEKFSNTTARHKSKIAGLWNVDINESIVDEKTFKRIISSIKADVSNTIYRNKYLK